MTAPSKNATVHNTKGDIFSSFDVADFAIPQGRDEVWRFVPLRRLRGLHDGTFSPAVDQQVTVTVPGESTDVTVETVSKDDKRLGRAGAPVDRVAAQAWTSMNNATIVSFAPHTVTSDPVTIEVRGSGDGVTSFGAVQIDVGDGAEATVHLHFVGSGAHADNHEFIVGDNARLNVVVFADWEDDAVHLSGQRARIGRDGILRHYVAVFGGSVVRMIPQVRYANIGGDVELLGVYFADDGQFFENRLLVDHSYPNCRSLVLYKGALQGDPDSPLPDTRTAWVGDVLIRSGAQGTDTYETNRNLVLTKGARADAVPNLEIETGQIVGAGHAATVGRFDDDQLYYLMTRGIPKAEATRLIVRGFFSEVIGHIPITSVREILEDQVSKELEGVKL